MRRWRGNLSRWAERRFGADLQAFAGDSGYVAAWQAATTVADMVQIALITHILGLDEFGRLALVTALVTMVGKFFDVRVGVAVTTFGAAAMKRSARAAASVFRFGYAVDALTGVLAALVLIPIAFAIGPGLIGVHGALLVLLYSLALLVSTVDETSVTILRLLDRYRLLVACTVPAEACRIALVLAALVITHSLVAVVIALVVSRALLSAAVGISALGAFKRRTGQPISTGSLRDLTVDRRREMTRTVLHTNAFTYAQLAQTQLPTLVLGATTGPLGAGAYKVAISVAAGVSRFADPARIAILPRLAQLWTDMAFGRVRRLLRSSAMVAIPAMAALALLVIFLRQPLLELFGGSQAISATAVVAMGVVAYALDGALFWNTSLRYCAGQSRGVAIAAVSTVLLQIGLLVPLSIEFGPEGAAIAFLISVVLANAWNTAAALRALRRAPEAGRANGGGVEAEAMAAEVTSTPALEERLD